MGVRLPTGPLFACARLHVTLAVGVCLARQPRPGDGARTQDTWRGQGAIFPSCAACPQGRLIRAAVDPDALVQLRGPGERRNRFVEVAARRWLERVGLLDPVPSRNEPPG